MRRNVITASKRIFRGDRRKAKFRLHVAREISAAKSLVLKRSLRRGSGKFLIKIYFALRRERKMREKFFRFVVEG